MSGLPEALRLMLKKMCGFGDDTPPCNEGAYNANVITRALFDAYVHRACIHDNDSIVKPWELTGLRGAKVGSHTHFVIRIVSKESLILNPF